MQSLAPLRTRRTQGRVLAIEGGEVMCPRRGTVDLEDCWICPAYRGLSGGRIEGLVCGADRLTTASASLALAWPRNDRASER